MDKTYSDLMDIVNRTKKYDTPSTKTVSRPKPPKVDKEEPVEFDVKPKRKTTTKSSSPFANSKISELLNKNSKTTATKKSSTTKAKSETTKKATTTKKTTTAKADSKVTKSTKEEKTKTTKPALSNIDKIMAKIDKMPSIAKQKGAKKEKEEIKAPVVEEKKVENKPAIDISLEQAPEISEFMNSDIPTNTPIKKTTPGVSITSKDPSSEKEAMLYSALKNSLYSGGTDISEYVNNAENNDSAEVSRINDEITKEQQEYEQLFTGSLGSLSNPEETEEVTNTNSNYTPNKKNPEDSTYQIETGNKDLDKKIADYYKRKQQMIDKYNSQVAQDYTEEKAEDKEQTVDYDSIFSGTMISRDELLGIPSEKKEEPAPVVEEDETLVQEDNNTVEETSEESKIEEVPSTEDIENTTESVEESEVEETEENIEDDIKDIENTPQYEETTEVVTDDIAEETLVEDNIDDNVEEISESEVEDDKDARIKSLLNNLLYSNDEEEEEETPYSNYSTDTTTEDSNVDNTDNQSTSVLSKFSKDTSRKYSSLFDNDDDDDDDDFVFNAKTNNSSELKQNDVTYTEEETSEDTTSMEETNNLEDTIAMFNELKNNENEELISQDEIADRLQSEEFYNKDASETSLEDEDAVVVDSENTITSIEEDIDKEDSLDEYLLNEEETEEVSNSEYPTFEEDNLEVNDIEEDLEEDININNDYDETELASDDLDNNINYDEEETLSNEEILDNEETISDEEDLYTEESYDNQEQIEDELEDDSLENTNYNEELSDEENIETSYTEDFENNSYSEEENIEEENTKEENNSEGVLNNPYNEELSTESLINKYLNEEEQFDYAVTNERLYEQSRKNDLDSYNNEVVDNDDEDSMLIVKDSPNKKFDIFETGSMEQNEVEEDNNIDTNSKSEFYNEMERLQDNLINELNGNEVNNNSVDFFAEEKVEDNVDTNEENADDLVSELLKSIEDNINNITEEVIEKKIEEKLSNNDNTDTAETELENEEVEEVNSESIVEEKQEVECKAEPVDPADFDKYNLLHKNIALNEKDLETETDEVVEQKTDNYFYLSQEDKEQKASVVDEYMSLYNEELSNTKDVGDINLFKNVNNAKPSSEIIKDTQPAQTNTQTEDDGIETIYTLMGIERKTATKENSTIKVLYCASECQPFVASGGLADVAGSLPKAIAKKDGVDIRVVMPLYSSIKAEYRDKFEYLGNFTVHLSWRQEYCGLFRYYSEGVTYYFIDNERYFKRDTLYGYYDDGERFAYFSKAIVEALQYLNFFPDIIHCNDWQTALVSAYIKTGNWSDHRFYKIRHIYTIHNVEYQGVYGMENLKDLFGIDPRFKNDIEYNGDINLTKAAIQYCDRFTTVSDSYCDNLKQPYCSRGLHHIIIRNDYKLSGILNGIDYDFYNPATDKVLYKNYDITTLQDKALNKKLWQDEIGLPVDEETPMIAIVSRLVGHKGLDLVVKIVHDILQQDIQLVVVGTGDQKYVDYFKSLEYKYPTKVRAFVDKYSNEIARKAYGASDIFVMPSKVEPCGLSQMISSRYGSVPIVREVGGLKDSIKDFGCDGGGNGYTFTNYNPNDLQYQIERAVRDFADKKEWKEKMIVCMSQDFTWNKPAEKYINLYKSTINN